MRALYEGFEVTREIPASSSMHMLVNPYIEVAADGQSARSHWLSPGATGSNTSAGWVFGLYFKQQADIFTDYPDLPEPY